LRRKLEEKCQPLALTACASDREGVRAIEAGFQTHIAKPIEPIQLGLIIANLAGRI
jgi:two-component system CheB/CheR fusion protein